MHIVTKRSNMFTARFNTRCQMVTPLLCSIYMIVCR